MLLYDKVIYSFVIISRFIKQYFMINAIIHIIMIAMLLPTLGPAAEGTVTSGRPICPEGGETAGSRSLGNCEADRGDPKRSPEGIRRQLSPHPPFLTSELFSNQSSSLVIRA